jgi:hypothetical protein
MIEQPDKTLDAEGVSERSDSGSLLVPKWYALYTRSRFEKKMLSELTDRRIEVFLPMREILSRWKDRKKKIWPIVSGEQGQSRVQDQLAISGRFNYTGYPKP